MIRVIGDIMLDRWIYGKINRISPEAPVPILLQNIEKFIVYLREIENVEHVYSISDIMKRLNKNMHGDDQSYYRKKR